MVEGEILCSMISLTCLTDAIEIAKHKGCNVIIKLSFMENDEAYFT
jgi:hypothetical protein